MFEIKGKSGNERGIEYRQRKKKEKQEEQEKAEAERLQQVFSHFVQDHVTLQDRDHRDASSFSSEFSSQTQTSGGEDQGHDQKSMSFNSANPFFAASPGQSSDRSSELDFSNQHVRKVYKQFSELPSSDSDISPQKDVIISEHFDGKAADQDHNQHKEEKGEQQQQQQQQQQPQPQPQPHDVLSQEKYELIEQIQAKRKQLQKRRRESAEQQARDPYRPHSADHTTPER